jgi:sugar O-acyltransferase (sialic acid O-acetyltransferase NeuD family)
MKKKLIIFGTSEFAEIAYEYFNFDSSYQPVAFTETKNYIKHKTFCNLPVIDFDDLELQFPPKDHSIYVAISYTKMNKIREYFVHASKEKKYELASYISSKAFLWKNVKVGEHAFIFENNVIQPFVEIGSNAVVWSGNHLGHHSCFGNNIFISSHVVVSGNCRIGSNTFLGVNSTVSDGISIGNDVWVGPSICVKQTLLDKSLVSELNGQPSRVSTHRFFKI